MKFLKPERIGKHPVHYAQNFQILMDFIKQHIPEQIPLITWN